MSNGIKYTTYPDNILKVLLGENSFREYMSTVKNIDIENALEKMYETLTPRESTVLRTRYSKCKTLKEVGIELGVSGERVREIEAKALRKMRHPVRLKALYGEEIIFNSNPNSSPNLTKYPFLSSLNLSARTFNALCRAGYTDSNDFDIITKTDVMKIRGLGSKGFSELITALDKVGIFLDEGEEY